MPAPIDSANSVLLRVNYWVLVYAMDVDMSCLLVLIAFTKATIFYTGCGCLLVNMRKKMKYFSVQSTGRASTRFVGKQILEHKTMIISIILMIYRLSISQYNVYTEANGMQGYQVHCA